MQDISRQEKAFEHIPAALRELAKAGSLRRYSRRTVFITEGEPGSSMFVVLAGRVKVYASDAEGKECIFGTYGPGDIIGEMALDGQPRSASVEALTDVTCAMVPMEALKARLRDDPDFAFGLIVTLIQRSRRVTDYARSLALESVYQRLAALLNGLAVDEQGVKVIPEPLSQQDIAHRIGASRDMVSKIFKELSKGEYLSYGKKRIVLHKTLPSGW